MALFTTMLPLIGISILFSLTAGQVGPPPPPPTCDDLATESGFGTFSHERYPELFYECSYGDKYEKNCALGTLFSSVLFHCVYPEDAIVSIAPCGSSNVGNRIPGLCGDTFWQCSMVRDGYGYVKGNCSTGTRYDATSGQCVAGVVQDHPKCFRPGNGTFQICRDFPALSKNPCKYRTQTSNTTWEEERWCAEGVSFNETNCQCSISNASCKYSSDLTNNKKPDADCKYSIRAVPMGGSVVAYSEKLATPPKALNLTFAVTGGVYVGNTIQFSGDGSVYFLETNNQHLTSPVCICITFRITTSGTTVRVISNRFNNYCQPTLEMNATRTGNTYSITAQVTGMTLYSPKNKTETTGSISVSATVAAETNFMQVCLIFDGKANLRAVDKGPDGTVTTNLPVTAAGTTNLGASLSINKCAFECGKGAAGYFQELRIHEGCANTAKLAI